MQINFNLFKNNKKENENQPDYRGNDKDNLYEVACWAKKWHKDGKEGVYLSCTIKDKQNSQNANNGQANSHSVNSGSSNPQPQQTDDSLPF